MTTIETRPLARPQTAVIIATLSDKPNRTAAVFKNELATEAMRLAKAQGYIVIEVQTDAAKATASLLEFGRIDNGSVRLFAITAAARPKIEALIAAQKSATANAARPPDQPNAKEAAKAPAQSPSGVASAQATSTPSTAPVAPAKPQPDAAPVDTAAAAPLSASKTQPESAPVAAPPSPPKLTAALWEQLKIGDVVLAAELDQKGKPDGWYEAIITHIDKTHFEMRWRDYPSNPKIRLPRDLVALMRPSA